MIMLLDRDSGTETMQVSPLMTLQKSTALNITVKTQKCKSYFDHSMYVCFNPG